MSAISASVKVGASLLHATRVICVRGSISLSLLEVGSASAASQGQSTATVTVAAEQDRMQRQRHEQKEGMSRDGGRRDNNIGYAMVPIEFAELGTELEIERPAGTSAVAVEKPFIAIQRRVGRTRG